MNLQNSSICLFLALGSFLSSQAQPGKESKDPMQPAKERLLSSGLDKSYEIDLHIKPSLLRADLNADGFSDLIVAVSNKINHKKGLIIFHSPKGQQGHNDPPFIAGAGTKFGDVGNDFKWIRKWAIYTKSTAEVTIYNKKTGDLVGGKVILMKHPGLLILDEEGNGCIIYWDKGKYTCLHQGE